MKEIKIQHHLIKIVGLLGEFPQAKRKQYQNELLKKGYKEDVGSYDLYKILKDVFYPDFRNMMFIKTDDESENNLLSRRFDKKLNDSITFLKRERGSDKIIDRYNAEIKRAEIFLFGEQIGLFAITLKIPDDNLTIGFASNLINQCRNFDSEVQVHEVDEVKGVSWHQWISVNCLCGTMLRDDNLKIKADEFSGSKFKVFSVFDCDVNVQHYDHLLFDIGTSSPIGSADGKGTYAPHEDYYNELMKNKISIFRNWESLCLFDSFTTIGSQFLPFDKPKWEDTYFRIYLFRLFFKYNLYRYNSDLHENTLKLRDQFEKFLNNYNLSHISFNFLPNDMFKKLGDALHLEEELETFQQRVNRISTAIQEEKQSRTNALLQFVSILGGLGSVQPVFDGLTIAQKYLGWSNAVFYTLLVLILFGIGLGILAFLMPEVLKKIVRKIKNK